MSKVARERFYGFGAAVLVAVSVALKLTAGAK
jgi:hypothetical protein